MVSITLKNGLHYQSSQIQEIIQTEINNPMILKNLLESLGVNVKTVWLVIINDKTADLDSIVRDEDNIIIYPPVGGG